MRESFSSASRSSSKPVFGNTVQFLAQQRCGTSEEHWTLRSSYGRHGVPCGREACNGGTTARRYGQNLGIGHEKSLAIEASVGWANALQASLDAT